MSIRITPDQNQPSASIEIPLLKPIPDYDLLELQQPTPRDVDAVLVSQGFRDLIDDARGVLMELLSDNPPADHDPLHFTQQSPLPLELTQLTGAICPGDDDVYRPGIWFVLRDPNCHVRSALSHTAQERIAAIAAEFVKRLQLA